MKKSKINLQINIKNKNIIPKKKIIKKWIDITLKKKYEITIRIVDILEMKKINSKYRYQNKPTNILSFSYQIPKYINSIFLGDLIICAEIIYQESRIQKKTLYMHWAHIIIHGILHLIGYNHNNKKKKNIMEKIEINIMKKIGYKNPYII